MPINDSLIGAVTMKLSATLPASTKPGKHKISCCRNFASPLGVQRKEFPSKHLRPRAPGYAMQRKWEAAECNQPKTINTRPGGAAETS